MRNRVIEKVKFGLRSAQIEDQGQGVGDRAQTVPG